MWSAIAALIPVLIKIIGAIIERSQVSKEQKEAFLRFVETYEKLGNSSVHQHDDGQVQLDDLNNKE